VNGIQAEGAAIEGPLHWIEVASLGIELLAVSIIVLAIVYATIRYVYENVLPSQVDERYEQYKRRLGRSLLLGLEILVAADIVRTVALDATLESVMVLGLLVVIRTFLSWSLVVEIEGRWPWQQAHTALGKDEKAGGDQN
jgi:uncharacterized membrane protein